MALDGGVGDGVVRGPPVVARGLHTHLHVEVDVHDGSQGGELQLHRQGVIAEPGGLLEGFDVEVGQELVEGRLGSRRLRGAEPTDCGPGEGTAHQAHQDQGDVSDHGCPPFQMIPSTDSRNR